MPDFTLYFYNIAVQPTNKSHNFFSDIWQLPLGPGLGLLKIWLGLLGIGFVLFCVLLVIDDNRNSPIHLAHTSPRAQESYASPGQTMVSPGQLVPTPHRGHTPAQVRQMVSPGQLVPNPPRGRTPPLDRQWSVPGQLVPPPTGGPAIQGSQPVPKQIVIRVDPSVIALTTSDQPAVPDPLKSQAPTWARPTTTQEMSLRSSPTPYAASRSLAPSLLGSYSWML